MSTHMYMDDDGIIRINTDDEKVKNFLEFCKVASKELDKEIDRMIWNHSKFAWFCYKLEELRLNLQAANRKWENEHKNNH